MHELLLFSFSGLPNRSQTHNTNNQITKLKNIELISSHRYISLNVLWYEYIVIN